MDYGDPKINGVVQFNTKYRKNEICREIRRKLSCKHWSPEDESAVTCSKGNTRYALSCGDCTKNVGDGGREMGRAWCNNDCVYSGGSCKKKGTTDPSDDDDDDTTYRLVASGTCATNGCKNIKTASECKAAMEALTSDKRLSTQRVRWNPRKCFLYKGRSVYFNGHQQAVGKCTGTRKCLCSCATAGSTTPSPTIPCNPNTRNSLVCKSGKVSKRLNWGICGSGAARLSERRYCPRRYAQCGNGKCIRSGANKACASNGGVLYRSCSQ